MDVFFLLSVVSFLAPLLFFFFHCIKLSKTTWTSRSFRTYPLVGNLPDFLKNRHRLLEWMTEIVIEHPTNTVTFRRPGRVHGIITANPANVEHMLKTNFNKYPKGERFISLLLDFLGHGIFNSDGELWKVQRKTASFEFNKRSLRNFVIDAVHEEIRNRLLPLLQITAQTGKSIDFQDIFERFAFDNICKVAFGEDPACLHHLPNRTSRSLPPDFAQTFDDAANLSAERFRYALPYLWRIKKFFNCGSERKLRHSIYVVHSYALNIIRSRRRNFSSSNEDCDLLTRFIANNDNSDEFLRDIVVSFILAGRDTTSSTLAWFFWLLSLKPKVECNILKEIKSIRNQFGNEDGNLSFEELKEMHYLHAAISEALRLYPPVSVDTKECVEDDIMPDGTEVKKGWFVTYNAYAMGRIEGIWGRDCLDFKPERWLEKGIFRPETPYQFPAFHAGPRMCLGKELAYIQMKSIVACIVERFEIDVIGKDKCPQHFLSLTMRMKGGLPVKVRVRGVHKVD